LITTTAQRQQEERVRPAEEEEEEDRKPDAAVAVSQTAAEIIDLSHLYDEDEDELSPVVGRTMKNLEEMWRKAEESLAMDPSDCIPGSVFKTVFCTRN